MSSARNSEALNRHGAGLSRRPGSEVSRKNRLEFIDEIRPCDRVDVLACLQVLSVFLPRLCAARQVRDRHEQEILPGGARERVLQLPQAAVALKVVVRPDTQEAAAAEDAEVDALEPAVAPR